MTETAPTLSELKRFIREIGKFRDFENWHKNLNRFLNATPVPLAFLAGSHMHENIIFGLSILLIAFGLWCYAEGTRNN